MLFSLSSGFYSFLVSYWRFFGERGLISWYFVSCFPGSSYKVERCGGVAWTKPTGNGKAYRTTTPSRYVNLALTTPLNLSFPHPHPLSRQDVSQTWWQRTARDGQGPSHLSIKSDPFWHQVCLGTWLFLFVAPYNIIVSLHVQEARPRQRGTSFCILRGSSCVPNC